MTVAAAEKRIAALKKQVSKRQAEILVLHDLVVKEAMKDGCKHTVTRNYRWEWDSGYGRQSQHVGLQCEYCHSRSPYKDGRWIKPEHYRD